MVAKQGAGKLAPAIAHAAPFNPMQWGHLPPMRWRRAEASWRTRFLTAGLSPPRPSATLSGRAHLSLLTPSLPRVSHCQACDHLVPLTWFR